jgi:transcriptional regulator with XRE-family HTH domain
MSNENSVIDAAVARLALDAAYAHPTQAIPRPLYIFPNQWASEEHPEGKGVEYYWDVEFLARYCLTQAKQVRKKNTGPFLVAGLTSTGRRLKGDCTAVTWVALDADCVGDWNDLLAALDAIGAAYVAYRTPSHNGADKIKWRVWLPLAQPFRPDGEHAWRDLYKATRLVFSAVGSLTGNGFDPSTDDLLNRFYPPHPTESSQAPREVRWHHGKAIDVVALYAALGEHAPKSAKTTTGDHRFFTSWNVDTHGSHPLFKGAGSLGRLGKCLGSDLHGAKGQERAVAKYEFLCPWGGQHTGGAQLDSSTAIWADGSFDCKHAHCQERTAREVAEALGIELSVEEQATLDESRALSRVRAQLRDAPPFISLGDAQAKILEALRTAGSTTGATVLTPPPGTGKTHQAVEIALERARREERTVLLFPTHELAREVSKKVLANGITPLYGRGILEVREGRDEKFDGDPGEPVCSYPDAVKILQDRGISPRSPLCKGTIFGRPAYAPCPLFHACPAADPFEGPKDANIIIATHAYLPLLQREFPEAFFIVDEPPREFMEPHTLTPETIKAARDTLPSTRGGKRSASVRLVLDAILYRLEHTPDGIDVDPILRPYFETDKGRVALHTFKVNFDLKKETSLSDVWAIAMQYIKRLSSDDSEPLLPSKNELTQLRLHKGDRNKLRIRENDAIAWKTIDAVSRISTSIYNRRDGKKLHLFLRSKVWHAMSELEHLAMMDATANVAITELLIGKKPNVIHCDVADKANITRIIRPRRHLNRSELCPDGVAKVTDHLRGAVREDVDEITSRMPVGCSVVLCTYQPLAKLIKATWETGKGELADLLDPLRKHGIKLHVTYWNASDVRGSNAHQGAHVTWGIGNPRMNMDVAGELVAALRKLPTPDKSLTLKFVAALAADDIAQFVERLRPVQREGETLLSILSGEILPSIRWYQQNTTIAESTMGRPKTVAAMPAEEFTAIGKALGWTVRSAALALGISVGAAGQYRTGKRAIPPDVAKRVREMAPASSVGVHESGVQKKKGTLVSFTHFREQKEANSSADLRNAPQVADNDSSTWQDDQEEWPLFIPDADDADAEWTPFVPDDAFCEKIRLQIKAIRAQQASAACQGRVPPETD